MDDRHTLAVAFDIDSWDEVVYDEPDVGPKLTRVTIRETYRGELQGHGIVEVLTAQGGAGSGYLASERIVGRFAGREGSFVIQHGGLNHGDGRLTTFGTVVPNSGTGEFSSLSGEATEATQGVLSLRYAL